MAITYPLSIPSTPGVRDVQWDPVTVVGVAGSPNTGQIQTYVWPGQWWRGSFSLPPMKDPNAGIWEAFLLALNGQEGSFYFGDPVRKTPRGTVAGSVQVGAGAVANSTTLPLQGGTGSFAVGDYLTVLTKLHRVTQVNSSVSVDVWPRLRSAYAQTSPVTFTNPVGKFKLNGNSMAYARDVAKFSSVQIAIREDMS